MVNITIDGQKLQVPEGVTILEAARTANINIPTLCYHEDQKIKSVCRICAVEVEGQRLLQAACSYPVAEGMVIRTSTPTVLNARKNNLELLLAHHPQDCLVCGKNGRCELQKLTQDLNMNKPLRYEVETRGFPIDNSSPCITRDPNKCILCTRCVEACNEVQTVGTFSKQNRGYETVVVTPYDKKTVDTPCVGCGQCVQVCPVGALTIHDDTDRIYKELINGKILVAQVAPSVRVTIAEALGEDPGTISPGRLVTAMKKLGFHQVFDSDFSADLTIMEEGYELLDRIKNGGTLPMITSCCPGWVKFCETFSPKELDHLSSAKSPQQMFGAVIKTYYAEKAGVDPKDICSISIMPCTAKKAEAVRPNSFTDGEQDTDIVITTTELLRMIDNFGLDFATLDPEACDMPFGFGSGGGVIFGVTGGVTEAVLRRLTPDHSKETMHEIAECGVRGDEGIKEFTVPYEGMNLNICVASGLANAKTVMEQVKNGEKEYHLIEIMACRRGCIMGGGQPTRSGDRTKALRAKGLYNADNTTIIKKSDENPLVLELYNGLLKGKEHHLLHNDSY